MPLNTGSFTEFSILDNGDGDGVGDGVSSGGEDGGGVDGCDEGGGNVDGWDDGGGGVGIRPKPCLEMQSLKQDIIARQEVYEEVWCIKCKGQGHDKDHYPVFVNYVAVGGPMALLQEAAIRPSARITLWCCICQVAWKHTTDNFHLVQKLVHTLQQLFWNLCQSVGHDGHNF